MPDRRSRNFVKSTVFFYLARFLLLCTFYTINFTTLSFSVFLMVFLKKKKKQKKKKFLLPFYPHGYPKKTRHDKLCNISQYFACFLYLCSKIYLLIGWHNRDCRCSFVVVIIVKLSSQDVFSFI